ncbi:benzoate/H(+) symporter BenE family transporter [Bartonella sp. LJL80]
MRFSVIASGFVAAIVGFGGTLALVINAAHRLGATQAQTASWVTSICLAIALSTAILSIRHRIPIVTAWSTPGLALIAATSGYNMGEATGAFITTGIAIIATALIHPVSQAIARIPTSISSGMLAGVLFSFVVAAAKTLGVDVSFVLPLMVVFFIVRLFQPALAVIVVLIAGFFYAYFTHRVAHLPSIELSSLTFVKPVFSPSSLIGLALPLYLVTMASQNLPGFAVLRASGYEVPAKSCLGVTGLMTILSAFFAASPSNMAAISAAICTGADAHPDKQKRWMTGPVYSAVYVVFALFGASLVAFFAALPVTLIALVAGLGLLAAFINAVVLAMAVDRDRIAATVTFAFTASNISLLGIGAPFWALIAGLLVYCCDRALQR